jgi:hypothetical protein
MMGLPILSHPLGKGRTQVLLLTTIVASAGDAPWIEGRTEHFRVIADAEEKNRREAATRFEQMRAAYALLFEDERSAPQHVPR